ncbi:hypothetical protein MmazTMA_08000 [Methanosarcina mazei]|nr:hypothetical protein MmazTMA_08000 [Methanosarcina mazei]
MLAGLTSPALEATPAEETSKSITRNKLRILFLLQEIITENKSPEYKKVLNRQKRSKKVR